MLLLLSPIIAFLVFAIESETNLKGTCDYGLLHVWAFVLVGVFLVDLVSMTTFWTNTAYTRNELDELMKAQPSTNSLRRPSMGYNSFPVPDDTLCLPVDRCVLYQQREVPSEEDLDCAETANCCYFGFIPFAKVCLLIWGHVMLNGGELVMLPSNETGSRLDCFAMDTSSPLPSQFGTMSMFILIYGWVVWSCHLLFCCCPLTVRDVTTNENEFSRSRKRRKLYLRGRHQNSNGGNTAPIIVAMVNNTPTTNTSTAEDAQLNQAIQNSLSDVETGNGGNTAPIIVAAVNNTPTVNTMTRTAEDAQLNQAIQNSLSDVETGNGCPSNPVPLQDNPLTPPLLEEKEEEKEKEKEEEKEEGNVQYVAKGIGNATLYVGRSLYRMAAWGASAAFNTGEKEEKTVEGKKKRNPEGEKEN
jgi:hypothetical protein